MSQYILVFLFIYCVFLRLVRIRERNFEMEFRMIYHYQTLYCCGSIGDCNLSVIYVISEGNISCLNIKYNIQITEPLLEEHCSNKLENIVGQKTSTVRMTERRMRPS